MPFTSADGFDPRPAFLEGFKESMIPSHPAGTLWTEPLVGEVVRHIDIKGKVHAAIIVRVHGSFLVALYVISHAGSPAHTNSVGYDPSCTSPFSWHRVEDARRNGRNDEWGGSFSRHDTGALGQGAAASGEGAE